MQNRATLQFVGEGRLGSLHITHSLFTTISERQNIEKILLYNSVEKKSGTTSKTQ